MAIRLFSIMAFFAIVVLEPINMSFRGNETWLNPNKPEHDGRDRDLFGSPQILYGNGLDVLKDNDEDKSNEKPYLWAYVVFTYFFVAVTLYSINWETFRIVDLRQRYLGSQSTVTDRTFRLTGIPVKHRSEEKLKDLIEKLDICLVDSITLCRDWKYLDQLVRHRDLLLRKLEASWAKYLKIQESSTQHSDATQTQDVDDDTVGQVRGINRDEESAENARLLSSQQDPPYMFAGDRPQVSIRYGPLLLRSQKVDAIDYYEEKLRRLDEQIVQARKKEYEPTDMALVTVDSVASCQMVIQARIDPRPGRFLTKPTPSPSDLVWKNTYALRGIRRLKAWAITLFITVLTLVWIFPTSSLA